MLLCEKADTLAMVNAWLRQCMYRYRYVGFEHMMSPLVFHQSTPCMPCDVHLILALGDSDKW